MALEFSVMAFADRVASDPFSSVIRATLTHEKDLMDAQSDERVKIVGKGHASCFERLLKEWYQQEIFTDVVLLCGDQHRDGRMLRDQPEQQQARNAASRLNQQPDDLQQAKLVCNRSVLAAASPVLAALFRENPIVEEDLVLHFAGYSPNALKAVIEYVYTGSLVSTTSQRREIESILKDLQIHVPEDESSTVPGVSENEPQITTVTSVLARTADERPIKLIAVKSIEPTTKLTNINKTSTLPKLNATSGAANPSLPLRTVKEVNQSSRFSSKNKGDGKEKPQKVLKKILPAPKISTPAALPLAYPSFFVQKAPVSTTVNLSTPTILRRGPKPLKRRKIPIVIDVPSSDGKDLLLNVPILRSICPAGKFIEKICLESSFPAARSLSRDFDTSIPSAYNCWKKAARGFVSTFIDVPGIYSTYKDKKPVPLDFPYSCPPVEIANHLSTPSYFIRTPSRTYSRSRENRNPRPRLSFGGLKSENIDCVCQVGRKVHITTRGTAILNALSSTLYDDLPTAGGSGRNSISRLNLEHNYSFGETSSQVDEESITAGEQAEDLEDYKRALQLAINEQRRQNRLKHRMNTICRNIDVLKERAARLLAFCREEEDAHEIQPESGGTSPEPKPPQPMVECDICHKMVKETWLKRHKQVQHSTSRPHLCEECGRTFVLRAQLRTHQHRQHAPRTANHLCSVCGRAFRFAHYLRRHMSMHAPEKPYSCKYCDKSFRLRPVLIKHIRTHTGEKPYKCEVCGRCFTQRTTYANHAKMHAKWREMGLTEAEGSEKERTKRRLQCEFCSMTFRLDLFLNLHRSKHTGEIPQLPCPNCNETYPSIKELNQHRKSQHPETIFFCNLCPKSFTNKPNFDFHMERHRNPNATKKKYASNASQTVSCTCEFCGKELKSRFALDYHIKGVHLGDRPFKCTFCTKRFAQKPSLDQHLRTHTGERPYKCTQCPSAFKQGQHLTAHMVLHTGERPFKCQYCPKSFPHKTTLYAHLRIHTNTRWSCQFCRKVLPSGAQLQRHEETCGQRSTTETLPQ